MLPVSAVRGQAGLCRGARCAGGHPARARVDEGRTVTFGFTPPVSLPSSAASPARLRRMLEPAEWASAGIPLLRNPREVVTGLHDRHRPVPSTAVVGVLDPQGRMTASASLLLRAQPPDGWEFRNALLAQLRRVVPHDLRLRAPVRTAVLLYARDGEAPWTEADGAWMWALRDACTLHGLRCGAYITLTPGGWQVLGEGRGGRRPRTSSSAACSDAHAPTAPEPWEVPAAGPRSAGGGATEAQRRVAAR